jgi:CheY-like chemotaxis protein
MNHIRIHTSPPFEPDVVSILLVEDEQNEARLLGAYLEEYLGRHYKVRISCAISRTGARAMLDTAETSGRPFHAAILDYKLPEGDCGNPVRSNSLTLDAIERPQAVLMIAQNTAFADPVIEESWRLCAKEGVRFNLFDKGDPESARKIGEWIRQGLIEEEFTNPMQTAWFRAEVGAEPRPLIRGRLGQPMFDLRYFASRLRFLWPCLDERTRSLARQYFEIRFDPRNPAKPETIFLIDSHYAPESSHE